jgi:lysophospholipase L1-like esterase
MILGAINLLRKHNIKFIVVDLIETEKQPDLSNPVALADTNVLNGLKVEPLVKIPAGFREKYPNPTDDFHFNEEGQREVAKLLTPLVKELLSFNQ